MPGPCDSCPNVLIMDVMTAAGGFEVSLSIILILLALLAAIVDWWSVGSDKPVVETFAKPLVMACLVAAVLTSAPPLAAWLVALALLCSLTGDVALLPAFDHFLVGLGAFLFAHLGFAAAFIIGAEDPSPPLLIAGAVLAALAFAIWGRRIVRQAERHNAALALPVATYIGVLSTMLALGLFTAALLAALGAALFAASDVVLGWNRFVARLQHGRLATHVPYHLGQGLIALWAIGL